MFPITLTLTVHSLEELTAVYNALAIGKLPVMYETKSATGATIKSTTPPKPENAPAPEAAKTETKPTLSYEKDVMPKLVAFGKAKGREGLEAVLKEFGAARGTDVKPEQYEAFLTKLALG